MRITDGRMSLARARWAPTVLGTLLALALAITLPPPAHAVAYIAVPEMGLKVTLFGIDGPSRLPVRSSARARTTQILVHDTLFTIERQNRESPQTLAELWPEFESRLTRDIARSGFRVEGTESGKIGDQPAQLLKAKRDRSEGTKAHWQLVGVTIAGGHMYVFTLYSTERAPWKSKAVMKVLERTEFVPVQEEEEGDDE